jgi:hypothetical protein
MRFTPEIPATLRLVTAYVALPHFWGNQRGEDQEITILFAGRMNDATSGFDFSVLSEFRSRLIEGHVESLLFETMLLSLRQRGLLKAGGQQRTDATHVLAAVRVINRVVCVGETLRAALNSLAEVAPEWLSSFAPEQWYQRYAHRVEEDRRAIGEREAGCCCRNHRNRWIYLDGCDFYNTGVDLVTSSPSGRNTPSSLDPTV